MLIDVDGPKAAGFAAWHLQAADRHIRSLFDMLFQHLLIIYLLDVISSEKHDESRVVRLDNVDVLIDRVGRPEIPVRLGDALAGRQDVEAFVALGAKEIPAHLQMTNQAVRLVLRGNSDAADA